MLGVSRQPSYVGSVVFSQHISYMLGVSRHDVCIEVIEPRRRQMAIDAGTPEHDYYISVRKALQNTGLSRTDALKLMTRHLLTVADGFFVGEGPCKTAEALLAA